MKKQDSKHLEKMKAKPQPNAIKWLSEGLQESAIQLLRGDADEIATRINMSVQAIRPYLKGDVADLKTGKLVLSTARQLILDREKEIKKLVA